MDNHAHKEELPKGNQDELGEVSENTYVRPKITFKKVADNIFYMIMGTLWLLAPFYSYKKPSYWAVYVICPLLGAFFTYIWLADLGFIEPKTTEKHSKLISSFFEGVGYLIGVFIVLGLVCFGIYSLFGFLASASITTILLIVIIIILLLK